jgi:hypothetical protein
VDRGAGRIPGLALFVAIGDCERMAGEIQKYAGSRPVIPWHRCFRKYSARPICLLLRETIGAVAKI